MMLNDTGKSLLLEQLRVLSGFHRPKRIAILLFFIGISLSIVGAAEVVAPLLRGGAPLNHTSVSFAPKGWAITLYLFSLMLVCVYFLVLISLADGMKQGQDAKPWYWLVLSIIFVFFSVDLVFELHHKVGAMFAAEIYSSDWLWYSWVVVYAPFIIVFGLLYLRFLGSLPSRTRRLFILSGVVTISGAFLFEIVLGKLNYFFGPEDIKSQLFGVFKKCCEMVGIVIFLYALLMHVKTATLENGSPNTRYNLGV